MLAGLVVLACATGTVVGIAGMSADNLLPLDSYENVFHGHAFVLAFAPLLLLGARDARRWGVVPLASAFVIVCGACVSFAPNLPRVRPEMWHFLQSALFALGTCGLAVSVALERSSTSRALRVFGIGAVAFTWFDAAVWMSGWLVATAPGVIAATAFACTLSEASEGKGAWAALIVFVTCSIEATWVPPWWASVAVILCIGCTVLIVSTSVKTRDRWRIAVVSLQSALMLQALVLFAYLQLTDELHLHDTLFRSGWIHLAIFSAAARWLLDITPRSMRRALCGLGVATVGAHLLAYGHVMMGENGMPRAYTQYLDTFTSWHRVTGVAGVLMCGGLLVLWSALREPRPKPSVF